MTTTRQPVRLGIIEVNELNSCFIEFDILDEEGQPVPLAAVVDFTIDLYNDGDGSHINGRQTEDIKNANGGTYHATNGHASFAFDSADNPIVGAIARGRREPHTALFTLRWGGGSPPAKRWDGELKIQVANLGHVPE